MAVAVLVLAGQAGLEPAIFGFGVRCISQLCYWPAFTLNTSKNPVNERQPLATLFPDATYDAGRTGNIS
jgi:hypothetical protein